MFVSKNNLTEIRRYYNRELNLLYSASELRQIVDLLACKRLNISKLELILSDNISLSESDLLFFHQALKRLRTEEPFQYVLGTTEFADLILITDKRALIPRPETAELVCWVVDDFREKKLDVLVDLCSGSGCIGISLKKKLTIAQALLVELSEEAIDLIGENAELNNVTVDVIQADLLKDDFWRSLDKESIDVFVANPPYVCWSEQHQMTKNVVDYEPALALFVPDEDPLLFYRMIADKAFDKLKQSGVLYVEIHEVFGEHLVALMSEAGFVNIELRKDLQGKNRMLKAKR